MKKYNNPQLKKETDKYLQNMKQGSNNILVAVRIRPLLSKEIQVNAFETLQVLDQQVVTLTDPEKEGNIDVISRKNRDKTNNWAFDFAFDKNTGQKEIFDTTTKFLIDGVLQGFNCTVFAYGATGAGKTHTMVGSQEDPGIMPRTLNHLYQLIDQQKSIKEIQIKASYLEIYNEQIKDLLTQDDKTLEIREDANDGVNVINLTEITVTSTVEIMNLLKIGSKNRATDATQANEVSSRSHAVLQLSINIQEANQGINRELQSSKLSLVDLAGSERAAKTNNKGQRLIEGAKINQSLLTLGNCISALAEIHEKQRHNPNAFIPYRGSKLTRLLKDSLGGNCRTVMISNVSPFIESVEDTYNTLCFAHRAKLIKTNVQRNVTNVENHISNYANIIDGLRKENEQLKKVIIENKKLNNEFGIIPQPGQGQKMNEIMKVNKYKEQVAAFEKELKNHYSEELNLLKSIFEVEEKIENGQYQCFRTLGQLGQVQNKQSTEAQILQDRVNHFKQNISKLENERDDLQNIFSKLKDVRQAKLINIKQQDFNQSKLNFLLQSYKQGQLLVENQEIHLKESQAKNKAEQKQMHIAFLHNQMLARDHIIREQRDLLFQNNIKHDIQYNYLKDIKQITEEAQLHFPVINKNLQVQYTQPKKQVSLHKQRIYGGQQQQQNIFKNNSQSAKNLRKNNIDFNQNSNKNGVFHYKNDYQQHKKNQQDYMMEHKYKNQDKLKDYKMKQKEEMLRQIDQQIDSMSSSLKSPSQLPNISQNISQKMVYKNGKLQRDDQHLLEMEQRAMKYKQNQKSSKERQQQYLYDYKKKQSEQNQQRQLQQYKKKQNSLTDIQLNQSNQQFPPNNNKQQQQQHQFAKNNINYRNNHYDNNLSPNTSVNVSRNIQTPSDYRSPLRNHSGYLKQNLDTSMNHSGHKVKNTKQIIKNLEEQAPQRSVMKKQLNLDRVLDEGKNLDPLQKDRDQKGAVNLGLHYKQSPYVKSFEQNQVTNKVKLGKIRDMNMDSNHLMEGKGVTKQGQNRVRSRFQNNSNASSRNQLK